MKNKKPIKPMEQEREKPHVSEALVKQLASLDEVEQRQVLGFVQGITYAKLRSAGA